MKNDLFTYLLGYLKTVHEPLETSSNSQIILQLHSYTNKQNNKQISINTETVVPAVGTVLTRSFMEPWGKYAFFINLYRF
jgi:hypothetical protein